MEKLYRSLARIVNITKNLFPCSITKLNKERVSYIDMLQDYDNVFVHVVITGWNFRRCVPIPMQVLYDNSDNITLTRLTYFEEIEIVHKQNKYLLLYSDIYKLPDDVDYTTLCNRIINREISFTKIKLIPCLTIEDLDFGNRRYLTWYDKGTEEFIEKIELHDLSIKDLQKIFNQDQFSLMIDVYPVKLEQAVQLQQLTNNKIVIDLDAYDYFIECISI